MHETELDRMAGDDWKKRDRCSAAAWIKPKAARRAMVNGVLQMNCNFIFCFRAQEKLDWKNKDEKGQPRQMGQQPIAGGPLIYEMTLRALLPPGCDGHPDWKPQIPDEKKLVKLPEQFRWMADRREPLDEGAGERFARWAAGDTAATAPPVDERERLLAAIEVAPNLGALETLVPQFEAAKKARAVTPAGLEDLRNAYSERKSALSERQPGDEG
jgi:hypothetical protein